MLQSRNPPPSKKTNKKKTQQPLKTKGFYYKNSPYWSFTVTFSHYWFYSNAGGFPSIFGGTWPAELLGCDHTWSLSMMVEGQWFIGTLTHFTQDDWLICVPKHFWSINILQNSNHLSFTMGLFPQPTQPTTHPNEWLNKNWELLFFGSINPWICLGVSVNLPSLHLLNNIYLTLVLSLRPAV